VRILRCQPQRVSCIRQLHQTVASGSCNSLSGEITR
jgi:hypothetical protein